MSRLPEDQLKQLRDIFTRFDLDKDGSLTHLEVAALLRSLGLKPSGEQIHKLFNNMDSDGSGTMEFVELVNCMSSQMTSDDILINQSQLLEIFKTFDRDGSGFTTPSELAKSMTKMGQPLSYRELTEMVRAADTDGDGVISFKKFQGIMARSAAESLGFSL
ncbi:putative calcium-binding protein CML16 [Bidens hawaiensis]|uniref:putative calcium-binding protein CML16 n=1 Tax=Bidens hawaiensis TaxID=980011 RepID=UPI0040497D07